MLSTQQITTPGAGQVQLSDELRRFLGLLASPFQYTEDFSEFLKAGLVSSGWTVMDAVDPQLMYARPQATLIDTRGANFTFPANFGILGLSSTTAQGIEGLVRQLDMPVIGINTLSSLTRTARNVLLEGRDPSEKPLGVLASVRAVAIDLVAIVYAQMLQTVAYEARWHYPLVKRYYEALKRAPNIPAAVLVLNEEFMASYEQLRKLPINTALGWLASGTSSVSAIGAFGKKSCLLGSSMDGLPTANSVIDVMVANGPVPTVYSLDVYIDVLTLGVRQATNIMDVAAGKAALPVTVDGLRTRVPWKDFATSDTLWDPREVAAAIANSGAAGIIDTIAARLGWTSTPELEVGTLDFWGSNFTLTDGDSYTKPYGQVLYGLTPVLNLNSRRLLALSPYQDDDWNRSALVSNYGGPIIMSPATVKGMFNTPTGMRLEQEIVPSGGWMGEAHAQPVYLPPFPGAVNADPQTKLTLLYYSSKNPVGYADRWATDEVQTVQIPGVPVPTPVTLPTGARWPNWYPMLVGLISSSYTPTQFYQDWKTVFGHNLKQAQAVQYLSSDEGFRMRYPIAVDWGTTICHRLFYYDVYSAFTAISSYNGFVEWEAQLIDLIDWKYGPEQLEGILESMTAMWRDKHQGGVMDIEIGTVEKVAIPGETFSGVRVL